MQKLILSLTLSMALGVAMAASSIASAPNAAQGDCKALQKQMRNNHQLIENAYQKNDACTMGKIMIENRKLFESGPECFKKMQRIMAKHQDGLKNQ